MSTWHPDPLWNPVTYTARGGRRITRETLGGREGGEYCLLHFHDTDTGEFLGEYSFVTTRLTRGPMFQAAT